MAKILDRSVSRDGILYSPPRKLKNSTYSTPRGIGTAFPEEAADIPDKFATTEHPKLKFLFSVEFFPRRNVMEMKNKETGSETMEELIFALKRASRPNISATYQNINEYNYRTQVLTKIEYGSTPATLSFYDDTANRSLGIIVEYLKAISPIFNTSKENASYLNDIENSSVGSISSVYGPLEAIRVTHFSINPDDPNRSQVVYYDYINPKILNITLDDLDMTSSDVTNVEFSFVYDTVSITTNRTSKEFTLE